jgi:SAM-dependent methyltransferase
LNKFIKDKNHVLDIGCGFGAFVNNIKASKKTAIDLNPNAKTFLNDDVAFFNGNILELNLSSLEADFVFMSNFLEHLHSKDELELLLENIYSSLPVKGRVAIMGPNIKFLKGSYWDFYDHHLPLTHLSLCEVLKMKGFKVDLCISKFLPYTTKGNLPTHPLFVKAYLKFPFLWSFFGKQFFVIASK